MVNKKGFLRIVEATIAILIVLAVLIFLSAQRNLPKTRDIGSAVPSLLDEIARNSTLREEIANGNDEEILENYVELSLKSKLLSPTFNVSVEICGLEESCYLEPYPPSDPDIFSSERVVSGSVKNRTIEPKKIKVFMWREGP